MNTRAEAARQLAYVATRQEGCNCEPDIDLTEVLVGIWHAEVRHDDWCSLLVSTGQGMGAN